MGHVCCVMVQLRECVVDVVVDAVVDASSVNTLVCVCMCVDVWSMYTYKSCMSETILLTCQSIVDSSSYRRRTCTSYDVYAWVTCYVEGYACMFVRMGRNSGHYCSRIGCQGSPGGSRIGVWVGVWGQDRGLGSGSGCQGRGLGPKWSKNGVWGQKWSNPGSAPGSRIGVWWSNLGSGGSESGQIRSDPVKIRGWGRKVALFGVWPPGSKIRKNLENFRNFLVATRKKCVF